MKDLILEIRNLRRGIDGTLSLAIYILADQYHYSFIASLCVLTIIAVNLGAILDAYKADKEKDRG